MPRWAVHFECFLKIVVSGFLLSMTLVEYNIYVCLYVWLLVMCVHESVVGRCTSTDTQRDERKSGEKKRRWEGEKRLLIDLSVHKCLSSLLEIGISRRQYQRQRAWRTCCLCSLVFLFFYWPIFRAVCLWITNMKVDKITEKQPHV